MAGGKNFNKIFLKWDRVIYSDGTMDEKCYELNSYNKMGQIRKGQYKYPI